MIVFVTGGARSGKSSFVLSLASKLPGKKAFIATAEPLDEEMRGRIERHKKERNAASWKTFEEPNSAAERLEKLKGYDAVVLDCLTLWLSNVLRRGKGVKSEIKKLLSAIKSFDKNLYIVSNEVGMGIVPDNAAAREFRDLSGRLNREVARAADEVYIIVSGMPVKVK